MTAEQREARAKKSSGSEMEQARAEVSYEDPYMRFEQGAIALATLEHLRREHDQLEGEE